MRNVAKHMRENFYMKHMETCDGSFNTADNDLDIDLNNPSFVVSDTENIFNDFYIINDESTAAGDVPVNVKQTKEFQDVKILLLMVITIFLLCQTIQLSILMIFFCKQEFFF